MNKVRVVPGILLIIALAAMTARVADCRAESRKTMTGREASRYISEKEDILARWRIDVLPGGSREYITTNKIATHFSCEAAGPHSRSYHGLFSSMHEYLDSWSLVTPGGPLDPRRITGATALPWSLYRWYGEEEVMEKISLPDERNGLIVDFHGIEKGLSAFIPWVDMRFIWDVPKPEYRIFWEEDENVLLISRMDDPFEKESPRWVAITSDAQLKFESDEKFRSTTYPKDMARKAMGRTEPFSPGRLIFEDPDDGRVTFVIGLGIDEDGAVNEAKTLLGDGKKLVKMKRERLEKALEGPPGIPSGDKERQKAYRWARASMDNLVMTQRGRGIYAGFHWFPNYWGRDSFICLPGACISTGRLGDAREILESFMSFRQVDPEDPRVGRLPNIVNPDNLQYAGVDGTWWFIRAAWKYFEASADLEFLEKGWPVIQLAIDGALEKRVDGSGFLKHGDGETWMDAGGEHNPYSPRGDRAVEIQALFHHGLLVGASWAERLAEETSGSDSLLKLAEKWRKQAENISSSFRSKFYNSKSKYLFDHLDRDGRADLQIRPNAILALWVYLDTLGLPAARRDDRGADGEGGKDARFETIDPALRLIEGRQFDEIVRTALERVVLPHGVTSLDPDDPAFHPYHLALDDYYYDEAYHNGDVWEWLSGPMISCLLVSGYEEAARTLFDPLVREILTEGCVGSLREIRDGAYTGGKEEFGGATSQAWSLAEFIRVSLGPLGL